MDNGKLEEAKAKYDWPWQESNNPFVLFIMQAQEEILLIDIDKYHQCAEQCLQRNVWSHEFAKPKNLLMEYAGLIDILVQGENDVKHRKAID